jgi:hypothetical protein
VPNHAEQWINACTIERLGVGMSAQEADLEAALETAACQAERFREGYQRIGAIPDGAAEAAALIMSRVERTRRVDA